jgi:hypothetical protein
VIYYGQKAPHGDITTNKLKAKMIKLGTGSDLWVRVVDKILSTNKLHDFLTVATKLRRIHCYFASIFFPLGTHSPQHN